MQDSTINESVLNKTEDFQSINDLKNDSLDFSSSFMELVKPTSDSFVFYSTDNNKIESVEFSYKNYKKLPLPQTNKPFKNFISAVKDDIECLTLCD